MAERMRVTMARQTAQRGRGATEAPAGRTPLPAPSLVAGVQGLTVEELVEADAIRNLAELLHPEERERYAAIIALRPTAEERAAVWKYRRQHAF